MFEYKTTSEKHKTSAETIPVSNPSTGDDSSLSLSSEIVSVPQHLRQDVQCSDKSILPEGENIMYQSSELKGTLKRPWQTGDCKDQPNSGLKRVKTFADHSQLHSSFEDIQATQRNTKSISNDSSTTPQLTSESSAGTTEKAMNQPRASALSSFSSASSSFSSSDAVSRTQVITPSVQSEEAIPEKSTRMSHLRSKYYAELDYMLREFRKLERQLLGAKGNGAGVEESQGSRERREKLHSFILHLEDTIRQIEAGCSREIEFQSKPSENQEESKIAIESCSNDKKDDAETVQKLEDHILANLLPVKVRLKKQLAAQQGATRNPIGMPIAPRGMPPVAEKGMGTFAAAAEEKRKMAEAVRAAAREQALLSSSPPAPSQFGQPITVTGSSLTQKLHGSTLGSQTRPRGHGVGSDKLVTDSSTPSESTVEPSEPPKRKILYGGMAPGSKQILSGVSAAAGAHNIIVESPALKKALERTEVKAENSTGLSQTSPQPMVVINPKIDIVENGQSAKPNNEPNLSEEERKRMQRQRRKKKKQRILTRREKERQRQLFLQQQVVQASASAQKSPLKKSAKAVSKVGPGKKSGPRAVEYICALCSEAYGSTCDCNPWWALTSHECPKCRKCQIPRIDITSPVNAIEYHPALLAHAEESPNENSKCNSTQPSNINTPHPLKCTSGMSKITTNFMSNDSDEETDLSELSDADILSDDSYDSDNSEDDMPLTEGELAEMESFGKEYEGPTLTPDQASRLLIMMGHAQTCPGRHKSQRHLDCCNSVKFLMLHVRDCPGTTLTMDVCPFPWCRKVKHLMYHLVACSQPDSCAICSPIALSSNMKGIIGLSNHRQKIRKTVGQSPAPILATIKPHPVVTKSSHEVKPHIQSENRTIVKKLPCPVTTIKPSTVKSSILPLPKANLSNRATSNNMSASQKAPTNTKPTNGVVVKSLVKPAGRSIVILKTRAQRPGLPGSKPTVAALCGSKTSLMTTHENGDTSSAKVLPNDPGDTFKQGVSEGISSNIAIDELEVAIVEDLIMTGDIHGTSDRGSTEDVTSNQISQLNKEVSQDDRDGRMEIETKESISGDVLKLVPTISQAPLKGQDNNDLSLVNSTTTAIVSSDVSTATVKSEDQITLSIANLNAEDFFSNDLDDQDNGKLMEAIIQETVGTSSAVADVLNIPHNTSCNGFAMKREGGESSSFLLLDSSFNILASPRNASTFSLSAIAELHDDDLKIQQLPSGYEYTEQITTSPRTSSSPISFHEVPIKVEKGADGD